MPQAILVYSALADNSRGAAHGLAIRSGRAGGILEHSAALSHVSFRSWGETHCY